MFTSEFNVDGQSIRHNGSFLGTLFFRQRGTYKQVPHVGCLHYCTQVPKCQLCQLPSNNENAIALIYKTHLKFSYEIYKIRVCFHFWPQFDFIKRTSMSSYHVPTYLFCPFQLKWLGRYLLTCYIHTSYFRYSSQCNIVRQVLNTFLNTFLFHLFSSKLITSRIKLLHSLLLVCLINALTCHMYSFLLHFSNLIMSCHLVHSRSQLEFNTDCQTRISWTAVTNILRFRDL